MVNYIIITVAKSTFIFHFLNAINYRVEFLWGHYLGRYKKKKKKIYLTMSNEADSGK